MGQLFLVEVAEEEKGEGFLVDGPVCVTDGALDCGVQGLDVYAGGAWRVGLLGQVRLKRCETGQGARGERRRRGYVHVVGPDGACHDGCGCAPGRRSMRRDVRVASWSRSKTDARADCGDGSGRRERDYRGCATLWKRQQSRTSMG
jgi:hypothetical protein